MSAIPINLPQRVVRTQPVTAEWANAIRESIYRLAQRKTRGKKGSSSGGGSNFCIFGELVTVPDSDPPEQAIRGGIIHCATNNWFIADEVVSTATDYDLLVWISVACVVNTDDDGELLLPDIASGTEPTTWGSGASYPANTAPTVAAPTATVILPIGRLIVADGVASFVPSGCGNFTVTHCAGTVGYTRG
jgi:hypothetical protein